MMKQLGIKLKKLYILSRFYKFDFTNQIKLGILVIFILLVSSIAASVIYLHKIKDFNEYTTAKYFKFLDISFQLEKMAINEESMFLKAYLTNNPTYVFSAQQSHAEFVDMLSSLEKTSFDKFTEDNIKTLKKHESELSALLENYWFSSGENKPSYQFVASQYPFLKSKTRELSNYTYQSYDKSRLDIVKIINDSLTIIYIIIIVITVIFIICYYILIKISKTMQKKSSLDPLTRLFNRQTFNQKIAEMEDRNRLFNTPFSLILIDIDHFKKINDTYGHQSGDLVLVELAKLLISLVRERDSVCRYGGEEIAILLPNTGVNGAVLLAERLRSTVESHTFPVFHTKAKINITISMGVAEFENSIDVRTLIERVDSELYKSKANGRNRVSCYGGDSKTSEVNKSC